MSHALLEPPAHAASETWEPAQTPVRPIVTASAGWAVAAALIFGVGFFMNDHNTRTSLAVAYTRTAEQMQSEAMGGNAIRQVCVLVFLAFGTAALASASPNRRACGIAGVLLAAFTMHCLTSVLWADAPGTTIRRGFVLICFAVAALGSAKRLTGPQLLKVAVWLPMAFLAVGFLCELALGTFRPWASDYRFAGTVHPNTQGLQLATCCFASFMLTRTERNAKRYWIACGIGLLFILLTKSRTSAAGVLFSLGLLWAAGTDLRLKVVVLLIGAWAASGLLAVAVWSGINPGQEASEVALMGRQEQAESLTGRLPIWTAIWPFLSQRPLLGWGYESFWTPGHIDTVTSEVQWGVREAHNAYLETILGTGLAGLGLLLTGVLCGWVSGGAGFVRSGEPVAGFVFALGTFGLINACTESGMVMPMFTPLFFVAAVLHRAFFPDRVATGHTVAPA